MLGTFLNAGGILFGGLAGLLRRKPLTAPQESFFKVLLGVFAVFYGLRLTWSGLSGLPVEVLKQLGIAVLALICGKLTGRVLSLQTLSNRLGKRAADAIASAGAGNPIPRGEGFKICAGLFCAAPLGVLGAVQDGLNAYFYPLAIKAVMDGLATMGLARLFGRQVLLAAFPVLALQGTITLLCSRYIAPWLEARHLLLSVNCVGGLQVFCVALVILQLKRIALAEYLPALVFAPLFTSFVGSKG